MVGGLWSAWLFWFFEALVCVSGKTKCAKCVGKKFPFLCVGYFLFFSVSDCCLVRCRSVGSGSRPVIATNVFGLCVRAGSGAQSFNLLLMFNRSTKLQVCTSARLTQNPCWQLWFPSSVRLCLSGLVCRQI